MRANIAQIGQASRMARCFGLDRCHPSDDLDTSQRNRAHTIWWTVCLLDQRFSAMIDATPDYRLQDYHRCCSPLDQNCGEPLWVPTEYLLSRFMCTDEGNDR